MIDYETSVNFTIDWLSVTFSQDDGMEFIDLLTAPLNLKRVKSVPAKGYNHGGQYESGLRWSSHTDRPEQGVHVVMSGACLRWYQAAWIDWENLLTLIRENRGRTSRIDLAFDMKNSGLDGTVLSKSALKPYKGKGRTPAFNTLRGADESWTVYIGRRQSDKFLRIYDKAKEQGDYESDYVRVELEVKGKTAHALGWQLSSTDKAGCAGMAKTLILGVADFDLRGWSAAWNFESVGFSAPQGREKDTLTWLYKTCAPALAKEMAKRNAHDVLSEFWHVLSIELGVQGVDAAKLFAGFED